MDDHIETIDQLEILRVLGEDREKEWDSAALAGEVQAEPQAVRAHLAAMHARGLLMTTTRGAGLSCRFGVSTPELEDLVSRVLQTYKERPVTMIKMVYERAKDPLRAFADAFRIRKED
jgi:predicted ArsR family transcriptional regulator